MTRVAMGSLEGHLLAGTFFLCFGIWWTYALFDRFFHALINSSLTKGCIQFECTATYSHFEGWFKIAITIIGIIAEFYTALDSDLHFTHINNSQHMTMYLFFLINGTVDLLLHYGYPIPKDSDYLTLCLGVAIEALLFCFHLHGRTALDIQMHSLLIIAITASTLSVLIEWKFRHNVLSALIRCLCALLQGFWFYTIGFILFPPFSRNPIDESHSNQMLLTSVFCWEIAAILLILLFVGFCFYGKNRRILKNKVFLSNNRLFNSFLDNDYKNLINESQNNHSKEQITQIRANSIDISKYSTISTSDDEI